MTIDDLLRELACPRCRREYGVFAVGLFCPDCGAANLAVHFSRELELVEHQLDLAAAADNREISWRLLGNAHEDVLTALETYLKVIYQFVVRSRFSGKDRDRLLARGRGNTFQSLDRAADRYADLGVRLLDDLDEREREVIEVYIHARHVIGHNLGIVDEKFTQTTDLGSPGETVALSAEDVQRFARAARHIIVELEDALPELRQE